MIERPFRRITLGSVIQVALRARRKQHEVRLLLGPEAEVGVHVRPVDGHGHVAHQPERRAVGAEAPKGHLEGTARGLAYRLYESLGLMPRQAVAEEVKGLDQDVRAKMRKLGVKFGAYHIYVPLALKPAPRELALILYGLKHGGVRQPGVSEL